MYSLKLTIFIRCIDGGHLVWFYSGIVAWRPLPEPYTEEKE